VKILELASRAADLFSAMTKDEKRETLKLVLSNPVLEGATVRYKYKMPFAMTNGISSTNWLVR